MKFVTDRFFSYKSADTTLKVLKAYQIEIKQATS